MKNFAPGKLIVGPPGQEVDVTWDDKAGTITIPINLVMSEKTVRDRGGFELAGNRGILKIKVGTVIDKNDYPGLIAGIVHIIEAGNEVEYQDFTDRVKADYQDWKDKGGGVDVDYSRSDKGIKM